MKHWSVPLVPFLLLFARSELRAEEPVDFQRDIRPLLSDTCFKCHGPDESSRKGKLRLDLREEALRGGRSKQPAIVVGKPDQSALIQRLLTEEETEVMPPPSTGKKLTARQIDLLKRWIAQGARYQQHWAFVPPQRPAFPTLRSLGAHARTPLDRFVLSRLEREGLKPAPEASRETLVRRLYLDLLGLPPTPAQVDAFLADSRPDAYERLVDALLASPAHGERWGRQWLDAARYADSDGYEKDKPRTTWMYRDWVVSAINRDLPYDRFIQEQIAGDLLPGADQDQRVATGFLRNSMINEEGGIDPEQFRMEAMFDRMDALGKGVLGLTLACAQCHTHKYDPITQEEYYRLFAYLNDTHEASIAVYTPVEQMKRGELFRAVRMLEDEARHRTPDWQERLARWEEQVRGTTIPWQVVKVENAGDNAQRYIYHEDGSQTAWGYAPTKWSSQFVGLTTLKTVTGFQLELLPDPNLPLGGPGRSPLGLFALSEFVVEIADPGNSNKKQRVKFVSASADFGNEPKPLEPMFDDRTTQKRTTGPIAYAIDNNDLTAWGIDAGPGRRNVARKAVFVPEKPLMVAPGTLITFQLKQMHGGWNSDDNQNNNLGRFRFSVTDAPKPTADPLPRDVRLALDIPKDQRSPAQQHAIFSYWRTRVPEWRSWNEQIEALWKQHPEGSSQLALQAREKKRATYLLARGDFLKPTTEVLPGVPAALNPLPKDAGQNRQTLARWLTSRDSPTTARALVNRVWQTYFGLGLVATSEDLGVQSESPLHPELLDWLAVEFMDNGWSLKRLHRLIVTSATYRQSSRVTPELLQRDPDNRLLARGARFRMEGEAVRDITLSVSGLLTQQLGGPPVYPPAPAFLFQPPASYGPKTWDEATSAERYRRALYTFRFRSVPYPVLTNFDTPNGDASCVRRPRSNTPLQALTTLNETLFLSAARALAQKTLAQGGNTDAERLTFAFRSCTARQPSDREQAVLLSFLQRQTEQFRASDARAWELIADDPARRPKLPTGVTPPQAAAWTALARLLMNLDETITKE